MKQLDYALKQENPRLDDDLDKFQIIVDLLNNLVEDWDMLKKRNEKRELKYKFEEGLETIKIFDVEKLKKRLFTIDILWCLTENSPARYLKPHLAIEKDAFKALQDLVIDTVNHSCQTLGDPKVGEKSFKLSKCCLCNCQKQKRKTNKIKSKLEKLIPKYMMFEKLVLRETARITMMNFSDEPKEQKTTEEV